MRRTLTALARCSPPRSRSPAAGSATPTRVLSAEHERLDRVDDAHERHAGGAERRPGARARRHDPARAPRRRRISSPPAPRARPRRRRSSATPALYLNWTAPTVVAIQHRLAAISLGQARAQAQQAAASAGRDTQLKPATVANSGQVVSIAPGQGAAAGSG